MKVEVQESISESLKFIDNCEILQSIQESEESDSLYLFSHTGMSKWNLDLELLHEAAGIARYSYIAKSSLPQRKLMLVFLLYLFSESNFSTARQWLR